MITFNHLPTQIFNIYNVTGSVFVSGPVYIGTIYTRSSPQLCWLHTEMHSAQTGWRIIQHERHATHVQPHHQNPPSPFLPAIVVPFAAGPHLCDSLNEFRTISGIEIYWQSGDEPGRLPAWMRGSHCPECSEHMLLSCAACLTAKGWFNYINCLMTEERAAGPCMLVCDKRGNCAVPRPSLCKSDSNLENHGDLNTIRSICFLFLSARFWKIDFNKIMTYNNRGLTKVLFCTVLVCVCVCVHATRYFFLSRPHIHIFSLWGWRMGAYAVSQPHNDCSGLLLFPVMDDFR